MTKRLLREAQHQRIEALLEMSAGMQALAHHTAEHDEAVAAFVQSMAKR
jgi:enoyl-CoA hydratase/carnithine racemase